MTAIFTFFIIRLKKRGKMGAYNKKYVYLRAAIVTLIFMLYYLVIKYGIG